MWGSQRKKAGSGIRRLAYHFMFYMLFGVIGVASARAGSLLPDYEREARMMFHGACDQGKTTYITYWKQGGYILEIASIESKGTFYMMKRYLGEPQGWSQRYFIKTLSTSNLTEFAHEEWDEKVKQASVSYFNKLHDLETTCTKMIIS